MDTEKLGMVAKKGSNIGAETKEIYYYLSINCQHCDHDNYDIFSGPVCDSFPSFVCQKCGERNNIRTHFHVYDSRNI